jgi:hypothetical protein
MKVIVLIKATHDSEAGILPDAKTLADIATFTQELIDAGVMLGGEGLRPSSEGKRLYISGGKQTLIDGPFTETKELVGGYWLWQVKSLDDAVRWTQRCADFMPGGDWVLEIRRLFEADDFGAEYPSELRAQDERQRTEVARRNGK